MVERLWDLDTGTTAPSQVPPVGHVGHGPSGVAFYPGTGLPAAYDSHFFMCDFPGGVRSFAAKPKGAGFELVDEKEFLWELWPTDVKCGPDGAVYVSDWVQGWAKPEKGRIFRVFDPAAPPVDTKQLLAEGMADRTLRALYALLSHRDLRVRQAAQFELVARKKDSILAATAHSATGFARLHAIWGLGQLHASEPLVPLLQDPEAEVRAQAAKVLGDLKVSEGLLPLLKDDSPRVRLFAAMGLGKCKRKDAVVPLLDMLRENNDRDPFLRHAGVAALAGIGDAQPLVAAAGDPSRAVRLAALLVLRRLGREEVGLFLDDKESSLVLEASRAIYDAPIASAMSALAVLLGSDKLPERAALRALHAASRADYLAGVLRFVLDKSAPGVLRIEALELLADWEHPSARDRVLGFWHPVAERPLKEDVREDVTGALRILLAQEGGSDALRVHAIRAWGALQLKPDAIVSDFWRNPANASAVRVEALRAMAAMKDPGTKGAVTSALDDKDPGVREEAVRLLVRLRLPDTAGLLEKLAKEKGALGVRQAAVASLGDWQGPEADGVLTHLLEQWTDLPAGLHLEVLEAAGKRSASGVKEQLVRVDAVRVPNRELLEGGDAKAGREIFVDRLDVSCARCHAVKDKGGTVGPPLTTVGVQRTREQILDSILFPNKEIVQGYGQTLLQMKDDAIEVGRIEKESDAEIVLVVADGSKKKLAKAEVKARKAGLSAMPEDLSKSLSKRDVRDLVAYLAGLR
jgi:quinoprotein glucose dehydrogenase